MEHIKELMARYRTKGLLVDTNLLLVYFVGRYDPERVSRFKKTMAFSADEFLLLAKFLDAFDNVITTPNVVTEVSNLSGQLAENLRTDFYRNFAKAIPRFEEHYSSSASIASSAHFDRFGLTDSGIAGLAKDNYLVLTDDLSLFGYLQNLGIDAINFNHLRHLAWGS
jgi:hypothetical protein